MRMKMAEQTGVFDEPNFLLKREAKWAAKERERRKRAPRGVRRPVAPARPAWKSLGLSMSRPEPGSLMNVLGASSEEPDALPTTEAAGQPNALTSKARTSCASSGQL